MIIIIIIQYIVIKFYDKPTTTLSMSQLCDIQVTAL